MKILIYAQHFGPSLSGMPLSNLEIVKGLQRIGNKIEVISCRRRGLNKISSDANYRINFVPKWPLATISSLYGKGLLNWIFLPIYYRVVQNRINVFNPEVIFVADETSNCFWGSWARKIKTPYVSYCSVPYLYKWKEILSNSNGNKINKTLIKYLFNRMKLSYKLAKYVLAVSYSTKTELIKGFPEIKKKTHIVPRSINDIFFGKPINNSEIDHLKRKIGISNDNFVILSVSRLTNEKGIDDVMKAIASLDKSLSRRIKYIIVGQGPANNYLSNLNKQLGLEKKIVFLGKIPNTNLISIYDLCDVFVLPSRRGASESFGRVFVEAAARSKTSIAANTGGMLDVIKDGITGFLVDPGDVDALGKNIKILASDTKLKKQMGYVAKFEAQRKYTSPVIAAQLQLYLEKAVSIH